MRSKKQFIISENSMYDWNVARENMFDLRVLAKIKQSDLANILGYGVSSISCYETGRSFPRIDYLISFCDFFGISVDDLFKENLAKELVYL
jgi:transcriptional regulator with XRE-family HTH domain